MEKYTANIHHEWFTFLQKELSTEALKKTLASVETQKTTVYPAPQNVFAAFRDTHFSNLRVVIVGQDPYPNQHATGLAFSTMSMNRPKSLQAIFQRALEDWIIPEGGKGWHIADAFHSNDLRPWAFQGILLLNSILTVTKDLPGSHRDLGWEDFTTAVLKRIALHHPNKKLVIVLWGSYAQQYAFCFDKTQHLVLQGPYPVNREGTFESVDHFSRTNFFLHETGQQPVYWPIIHGDTLQIQVVVYGGKECPLAPPVYVPLIYDQLFKQMFNGHSISAFNKQLVFKTRKDMLKVIRLVKNMDNIMFPSYIRKATMYKQINPLLEFNGVWSIKVVRSSAKDEAFDELLFGKQFQNKTER